MSLMMHVYHASNLYTVHVYSARSYITFSQKVSMNTVVPMEEVIEDISQQDEQQGMNNDDNGGYSDDQFEVQVTVIHHTNNYKHTCTISYTVYCI